MFHVKHFQMLAYITYIEAYLIYALNSLIENIYSNVHI